MSYALCFSTRDSAGRYLAIRQDRNDRPGEHTFTAIRTADALYLSVDGAPPTVSTTRGNVISLGKIRRFVVGRGLKAGEAVLNAEVGTGWPSDVPKSRKREDLFK